jgi:hypothetical protein
MTTKTEIVFVKPSRVSRAVDARNGKLGIIVAFTYYEVTK